MKLEIISRYPTASVRPTPLLFVHGAWHAAWCWDVHFLDYFAQQGYEVHARTQSARTWRQRGAEYIEDVARAAQQLPCPPVLIGHSMGGLIVQKYLEKHLSPAAVLLAPPPPGGLLATALRIARQHPLVFARANLSLSPYALVATPGLARELLFSGDLPEQKLLEYWQRLQDESYLAFLGMLAFNLPKPGKVMSPLFVLGGALDGIVKPNEIEATARAYNARFEILAGMAHDLMLEPNWQIAAKRIMTGLNEWGV
jgi:pimeloyl-ACP methyl ester carboxylesterase